MSQFKSQFMNIMLERGFYNQCTNEDGFDTYLYQCETSGKPAVGYLGSDPTGDSLHVGHIVPLMMMRWFQKCGHKPLTLVGGATARIGDPSGKDKLRPFLDEETLAHNVAGLKKSFSKFLKFGTGATDAEMVDNWDWFKDINYLSFLRDIGTYYTVNRMLTMDSVKSRLEREQPMSFLEFNYMLLQGYDFIELYKKYGCPGTNRRFRPMGKHYLRYRTRTPQIRCGTVRLHQSDYHRLCRQKNGQIRGQCRMD